ncbi:MAG: hypothetical protein V7K98_21430 [Nostoc sp.]|uniref:hypothetical protein n=1 Tax=Nostoc sp. TaxID=1180 RepID=UPI002FFCEB1E
MIELIFINPVFYFHQNIALAEAYVEADAETQAVYLYTLQARDAINRRLYNNQSFVLTGIYRVFGIYHFNQIILTEPYWLFSGEN